MKTVSKHQLKKFHAMLNSAGLMDQKRAMISEVTEGRTESSKELNQAEYLALIDYLSRYDQMHQSRRKVFTLARMAGMIYGNTPEDLKMNIAKINVFLLSRGTVKKTLNELTKAELAKVIRQFEGIVRSNEKSHHSKQVKSMLNELNLEVK